RTDTRCGSSRRLLLRHELCMPGIFRVQLEARSPFTERRYSRIKDARTRRDLARDAELRETLAVHRLHPAFRIAIEDESARNETRSQSRLQSFERSIETVDRTA